MSSEKKEKTRKRRKSSSNTKEDITKKEDKNMDTEDDVPGKLTEEEKTLSLTPIINEKMTSMDVRIKYGFIKHLHRVLLSINEKINWSPEELLSMGLVFRDLNGIEKTVYDTVIKNMEDENNFADADEQEEETNVEDIN